MADSHGLLSRRRVLIAASVCAVIAAGSLTYAMASPGNGARYVTATVSRGDVEQTLNLTGSVQQVNQRAAKFTVSGTVKSVSVAIGDIVKAGQELARLDTAALQSAVRDAEASLAQAKATLETDQSAESTSSTTATELVATASAAPSTTPAPGTVPSSNQLQQQVKQAQQDVSADLSAAEAALAAAPVACAPSSSSPTPTSSTTASASPSATSSPSGSPGETTCLTALQNIQSAQGKTAKDEARLQQLLEQLAKAATSTGSKSTGGKTAASGARSSGSASSSTSGSRSATQGSGSGGTSSGTSTGNGQGTSQSTAGRTITDQAAVTSAQNALNRANSNLAAAVLTSPADGTVASVGLSAGSTAGTSSVIIAATGSAKVTVDVPLSRIRSVKVGQTVQVTADGSTAAVSGTVQAIGLLPVSSSSTTSYPVTVLVPQAPGALATGSRAKVRIVVATHRNVVIVPNSALTTTGAGAGSVSVLAAGVTTRKTVKIGAVGPSVTEVTDGVAVGDQVVIADRSQALPTNSSNTGRFGGGGGTGGGGFGRPGG